MCDPDEAEGTARKVFPGATLERVSEYEWTISKQGRVIASMENPGGASMYQEEQ